MASSHSTRHSRLRRGFYKSCSGKRAFEMTLKRPAETRRRRPEVTSGERIGERLIAIFCLGLVLFSPLVIDIFDRGPQVRVFGTPLLYFYLFSAWAAMIGLLAWVLERTSAQGDEFAERTRNREDRDGALQ